MSWTTNAELSAETQNDWIDRQSPQQFRSQPYGQMAKVFRNMGLQEEAADVLIKENEKAGSDAIAKDRQTGDVGRELWHWFWYKSLGKLIGYGYRSWNAFFASLVVIAIGAVLFKIGYLTNL